MLLDAHRVLQAAPEPQGRDAKATINRLAALYEAWGRPDKASTYRKLLPS